ncbi:MAG: hypothetical protein AABY84_09335 [Candidatus Firestonebacteria bacterium]
MGFCETLTSAFDFDSSAITTSLIISFFHSTKSPISGVFILSTTNASETSSPIREIICTVATVSFF